MRRHSNYSGLSSKRRSLTWSFLSELSLSDISNVSVISLLLLPGEIWNNHHYSSSNEMPRSASRGSLITSDHVVESESGIGVIAQLNPTSDNSERRELLPSSGVEAAYSKSVPERQLVTQFPPWCYNSGSMLPIHPCQYEGFMQRKSSCNN